MGSTTGISWADATWNPWQGCHKISAGCQNCYMFREKKRWGQDPGKVVRSSKATFNAPLRWKEPRRIFVCSWSDFMIGEADGWRWEAMEIMEHTPWHTYLILTKRSRGLFYRAWPDNVWLGVTVEDQDQFERLLDLYNTKATIRFASFEPLLGPMDGSGELIGGLNWVITGGESGPGARPMNPEWAMAIRDTCLKHGIPYFHKQNGGTKRIDGAWGGCELDGKIWHEIPNCGGEVM